MTTFIDAFVLATPEGEFLNVSESSSHTGTRVHIYITGEIHAATIFSCCMFA